MIHWTRIMLVNCCGVIGLKKKGCEWKTNTSFDYKYINLLYVLLLLWQCATHFNSATWHLSINYKLQLCDHVCVLCENVPGCKVAVKTWNRVSLICICSVCNRYMYLWSSSIVHAKGNVYLVFLSMQLSSFVVLCSMFISDSMNYNNFSSHYNQ